MTANESQYLTLLDDVLNEHAQLPSREKVQEVGFLGTLVSQLTLIARTASVTGKTGTSSSEERFSFSSFSKRRRARASYLDFRPVTEDKEDKNPLWCRISVDMSISEHALFFNLLKKFVVKGLTINELLVLDNLISQKWDRLSPEEKVFVTLVLISGYAAASGASSFKSVSRPLRRISNKLTLMGLLDVSAVRFMVTILDSLEGFVKAERNFKLKFVVKPVRTKKAPPKSFIGKGYTDGLGRRQDAESLEELTPEELLQDPDTNFPDHFMSDLAKVLKATRFILKR